jgi:hypothetical protein
MILPPLVFPGLSLEGENKERLECGHTLCLQGCTPYYDLYGVHTLYTGQREREKKREREKEIVLTGALAPFSHLVHNIMMMSVEVSYCYAGCRYADCKVFFLSFYKLDRFKIIKNVLKE